MEKINNPIKPQLKIKEPKQLADPKMRDRKDRLKAFSRFKDTAHKCFGNRKITGYGDGKKIICSICKKEVGKGKFKDGVWYCKDC